MNRYSLLFALLVASSFAVHPTSAGDGASPAPATQSTAANNAKGGVKPPAGGENGLLYDDPVPFIQSFLEKAEPRPAADQNLHVLYATVPHPVETHLASAFDHNVDALVDGLTAAGYLFDSSLIPWRNHGSRNAFGDDVKEKSENHSEDDTPGILLFRKNDPPMDPYANGIVVFLLSEKPTEGIALSQAPKAQKLLDWPTTRSLLKEKRIQISGPVRILGPTYSGSFASLVPVAETLLGENRNARVLIRSGSATGSSAARAAMEEIARHRPQAWLDFGSAAHDDEDSIRAAVHTLSWIGIDKCHTAMLSEGESLYGVSWNDKDGGGAEGNGATEGIAGVWSLSFPRDISSLRAGYEAQGIFDSYSPAPPWKRVLNLKSEEQSEGDSVRSFGGAGTQAAKESVLFGISEFLREHRILAVIIEATNEEDRFFLTQFLHAHNSGVRVVVIGGTRVFMRNATAQFLGDMMVDDFPMLPKLHDWTGMQDDRAARIFADSESQGIYFAALDLFAEPQKPAPTSPYSGKGLFKWYPEYSEPYWGKNPPPPRPPIYVVALGANGTWPVAENPGTPVVDHNGLFRLEMPFPLFGHDLGETRQAPAAHTISVVPCWKALFLGLAALTVLYCLCFFYANPVTRVAFSSFAFSQKWRFWLFKVVIPAAVAGCAFRVLAWAVEMPTAASSDAFWWWRLAECMTVVAPLGIVATASFKAIFRFKLKWTNQAGVSSSLGSPVRVRVSATRALISFLRTARPSVELVWIGWRAYFFIAALLFSILAWSVYGLKTDPVGNLDVGPILNTYREMYWVSGLSIVPTGLLLLSAILVWASWAGSGAAAIEAATPLPDFPKNERISQPRADAILAIGRTLPFDWRARWIWALWGAFVAALLWAHFKFPPFLAITTLESPDKTLLIRSVAGVVSALIFFDVLQFLWLWVELRLLLQALSREDFKRSFVPIKDIKWRNLWSFSGISVQDRRSVFAAQIDCMQELAIKHHIKEVEDDAKTLIELRDRYNKVDLHTVDPERLADDIRKRNEALTSVGRELAFLIEAEKYPPATKILPDTEAIQWVLACQCKGDGGRFSDEAEELARLPEWQQTAERFLCLMYIGFILAVVARLHSLLASVALMFSLVTLGMAIYPFVPFYSLLMTGLLFLALLCWAFFKVFSEMDTDPILSRIVNGDDRKLQGSFYLKFAEAIALPLLTLGSTILPGGAARLLELAQSLFSHAQ